MHSSAAHLTRLPVFLGSLPFGQNFVTMISCKMLPLSLLAHVLYPVATASVTAGASRRGVHRPRSPKAAQADWLAGREECRSQLYSSLDAESLGGHDLPLNLSVLRYSAILRVTCFS